MNGAGASATSCTKLYESLGARRENILMLDSKGVITSDRENLTEQKRYFATDRRDVHTLAEAIKGADVFLGLSKGNVLTQDMVRSMADHPIVFALANPTPEISYEDAMAARPDVLMSTGRSDYPNQINNVIGFPYIFRGALDTQAKAINEEMKIAAVHAIANLAKQPVPDVVNEAYHVNNFTFGPEYFIPKPVDPRLITEVSCAVAKAAMDSGVARKHIADWDAYRLQLRELMGYESKLTRQLYDTARRNPQRVVFAEGIHPNMLKAAVEAKAEGICHPIILGNDEAIEKLAKELDLSLEGIEIVNLRHPNESERRERYARILSEKRAREGVTYEEANDKMFERNYFGMMMVETGEADAFITGLYTKYSNTIKVAKEVIGIRPEFKHFGTMHILNSKKGTYFLADTLINRHPNAETLIDIAKLSEYTVRFFNHNSRYGHAELLQLRYGQGRKSGKRARSRGLHAAQLSRPCHRRRNAGKLCHEPRTARCQVSVYPSERKGCEYAYLPEPEFRQLRIQTVAVDGYGLRTHRPDTDGTEQAYPLYRF